MMSGLGEIEEFANDAESGRVRKFKVEAPNDRLKDEPLCGARDSRGW